MKSIILLLLLSISCFAAPPSAKDAKKFTDQSEVKLREEEKTKFAQAVEYQIINGISNGKYYCYIRLPDDPYLFKDCLKDLVKKEYELRYNKEDRLLYIVWGKVDLSAKKIEIEDLIQGK